MCFTHFKKSTTARIHTTQRHARVREEFVENNFYKLIFFPQITGLVIHGLAFELEKSKLFKQGPANTRQDIQRYFTGVCSWEAGTVTGVFYWSLLLGGRNSHWGILLESAPGRHEQ